MASTTDWRHAVKLANAAGADAANRSMKAGGRKAWNEDDRDAAIDANNTVIRALGFGHLISD